MTGGKYASVFIFYGPVPFRMRVFHSGKLPVSICPVMMCLIYVVVEGRGFWPVVGSGVPFSVFSGFLRVASLSRVTLVNKVWGRVVPVRSDVRWDLSGSLFLVAL